MVSVSWLYPDTTDKFQAHYSDIPKKKRKMHKCGKCWNEHVKLSFFPEDKIIYPENPKESLES